MTSLPDRIRELRVAAGMSQSSLADATKLSNGYISLLESGQRAPSSQAVEVIARALSTTVDFLQYGTAAPSEQTVAQALQAANSAIDDGDGARARDILVELDPSQVSHTHRLDFLAALGSAYDLLGDGARALELYERAATEARTQNRPLELAKLSMWLIAANLAAGALDRAVEIGEHVLAELRGLDISGSDAHLRLGSTVIWAMYERGDYLHASLRAAELIDLAETRGTDRGRGSVYWNASLIAQARGDSAHGVELAERALACLERQEDADLPQLRSDYAFILLRCSPPRAAQALEQLRLSHAGLVNAGWVRDIARNEIEQGRAHLLLGRPEDAARLAAAATERLAASPSLELCEARVLTGDAARARGDIITAGSLYRSAAHDLAHLAASARGARTLAEIAERLSSIDEHTAAADVYVQALRAARVPPMPPARLAG